MGGSERGRTSNPRFRRPVLYPLSYGSRHVSADSLRRERDSNPRYRESPIRRFSKPVPSTTRPSLQAVVAHDTCVDDYSVVSLPGGGGGIRTPGACARRFSRPLPSTTRPLLRTTRR